MNQIFLFCLIFLLSSVCLSLNVFSPTKPVRYARSTICNDGFGRQDGENLNITAPFIILHRDKVCDTENLARYPNKVVMYYGPQPKFVSQVVSVVKCIQDGGGLGAVMISDDYYNPGLVFHYRETVPFRNDSSLFLLIIRELDFDDVWEDYRKSNDNINETLTVQLLADINPWVQEWNSNWFFYGWRVGLPIINGIGIIFAFYAFYRQAVRVIKLPVNIRSTSKETAYYVLFDLFLALNGFILRFSYCIIGPALSTPLITVAGHVYLINISNPIEVITILIQTTLFVKWGAFGELKPKKVAVIQRSLLSLGIFISVVQAILAYVISRVNINSYYFVLMNALIILIVLLFASFIFIYYGMRLISIISRQGVGTVSSNVTEAKQRHKKKAIRWIMLGTLFQIFEIGNFALPAYTSFFWTPFGFCFTYCFVFYLFTFNQFTNVSAFSPVGQPGISADNSRKQTVNTDSKGKKYSSFRSNSKYQAVAFLAPERSTTTQTMSLKP
eukprot:c20886_g2_i1.p1 GENE.c20886_g2_i1~~c20886_g2_i1.p1  ORF type:complete len:500 (+),score=149.21 c20886_g2_i1:27-1526(+)